MDGLSGGNPAILEIAGGIRPFDANGRHRRDDECEPESDSRPGGPPVLFNIIRVSGDAWRNSIRR
jgi:hypothetical protein